MWRESNEFINAELISDKKRQLFFQVLELLCLPKEDFVFVFATEVNLGIWGNLGNYINIEKAKLSNKTIETLNIFRKHTHRHMIWISPKICNGDDIWFVWIIAHEIKLSLQAMDNYSIIKSLDLFYAANGELKILDSISYNIPAEIDCEIFARKVVHSIFGGDLCNKFIQQELHPTLYLIFNRIPLENQYDVKAETISVYRKYEQEYSQ